MTEDTELSRFRALQALVRAGATDTLLLSALRELCGPLVAPKQASKASIVPAAVAEAPVGRKFGDLSESAVPTSASQPADVARPPSISARPKRPVIITVRLPQGRKSSISIRPDSWAELLRRFPGEAQLKAAIHGLIKSPEFLSHGEGNLSQWVVRTILQRSTDRGHGVH